MIASPSPDTYTPRSLDEYSLTSHYLHIIFKCRNASVSNTPLASPASTTPIRQNVLSDITSPGPSPPEAQQTPVSSAQISVYCTTNDSHFISVFHTLAALAAWMSTLSIKHLNRSVNDHACAPQTFQIGQHIQTNTGLGRAHAKFAHVFEVENWQSDQGRP